uniref:peptidylprolyl isomerase n=1 Tax=Oryza nivara TaxID=4536 RepID=A0A0E0HXN2_ORYNI
MKAKIWLQNSIKWIPPPSPFFCSVAETEDSDFLKGLRKIQRPRTQNPLDPTAKRKKKKKQKIKPNQTKTMELSLSARLALPLSPAAGTARPRRPAAFACRCCSGGASHDGTTRRRWLASLLAATAAVGIGVAGGDADAVSTSRRALRSAKIPESEFTTLPNGLKFCYRVTGRQTILCYFPFSECHVTAEALNRYYDITVGSGLKAVKGSRVAVHYVAKWKGITFMTSRQGLGVGGGTPYGFDIGNSERGNVLKGLDLGVEGMKVGGQRLIIVPPELAYGKKGVQEIPPNATIEEAPFNY